MLIRMAVMPMHEKILAVNLCKQPVFRKEEQTQVFRNLIAQVQQPKKQRFWGKEVFQRTCVSGDLSFVRPAKIFPFIRTTIDCGDELTGQIYRYSHPRELHLTAVPQLPTRLTITLFISTSWLYPNTLMNRAPIPRQANHPQVPPRTPSQRLHSQ